MEEIGGSRRSKENGAPRDRVAALIRPAPGSDPMPPDYKAVVAIDFGTAGSGYAYAFLGGGDVQHNEEWPGHLFPKPKTLTQLLYAPDGKLCAWGYEVQEKAA